MQGSIFRPLKAGQIRLLELLPGPRFAPLTCRLEIILLSAKLQYEALSYVWGDSNQVKDAIVNNVKVKITMNLHTALVHLRHEEDSRVLWVDALCIDQTGSIEGEEEKAHQVQKMGDIFRQAKLTWIWLGEASSSDDTVMDYLCATEHQCDASALEFQPLHSFFSRSWFRRLWILQEALLSKQPIAKCGDRETQFTRVVKLRQDLVFGNLGNSRGDVFDLCYLKHCLREWDELKNYLSVRGGWPLVYAMLMTEQMECTLFADRVFALLGLATDSDRQYIKPNYKRTLPEVYTEVCAHIIKSPENCLAALHSMGVSDGSGLPSWARDWSEPKKVVWHFLQRPKNRDEIWSILPKIEPQPGYEWLNGLARSLPWKIESPSNGHADLARFSQDFHTMALKGIVVGTISMSKAAIEGEEWKDICEAWRQSACKHAKAYGNPAKICEAFGNALCQGSYRDGQKNLLTDCAAGYQRWINGEDVVQDLTRDGESGTRSLNDFGHRTKRLCPGRAFVILANGFLGLAPENVLPGDVVCFFMGCTAPFVLRPRQKKGIFAFVGETYVPGIMDGEWISGADEKGIMEFWIN